MAETFRLTVSLKKQPGEEAVHFKVDGGRFQSERTVKLNVNSKYSLDLVFKPAQFLQSLNIQGSKVNIEERERDESHSLYQVQWMSAGMDLDKRGKRHQVPLLFELEEGKMMKVTLQCKFYGETEKNHCRWGNPLTYIDLECRVPENSTYVDILKETYR